MPINTPGYSAQAALTDYTDVSDYGGPGDGSVVPFSKGTTEPSPGPLYPVIPQKTYLHAAPGLPHLT